MIGPISEKLTHVLEIPLRACLSVPQTNRFANPFKTQNYLGNRQFSRSWIVFQRFTFVQWLAFPTYLELQDRFERSRSGWMRLLRNTLAPSAEFAEYARCTEALYEAVRSVGRKPVLVDSSLTPRRAYALSRMPGFDLLLIHMVRDGRGIIWSLMKPGKKTMTKAFVPAPSSRTTRYWISANVQSLWVSRRVAVDRRKLIRYEDFVSDPAAAVTEIGAWVGEDLSALVDAHGAVATGNVRHTVAGNRVRMQKELVIRFTGHIMQS